MATPEARKDVWSVVAGVVVLAMLAVGLYIAIEAQTGWPLAKTTKVQAVVDDVHTLAVNDHVRQNSKRIGRVSEIEYHDGKALVTMELEGEPDIYNNARAEIWDTSTLAMKFVELDPGSASSGELEGPIPASHTEGSADLQELLSVLDPKTRDQATSALRNVGGGVAGHSKDLRRFFTTASDLLIDLATTTDSLASTETDLPALLRSANELAGRFHGREDQISSLVKETDSTLRAFSVDGEEPLRETLASSPTSLTKVRSALASLDEPLTDMEVAMSKVKPGARALGGTTADLRGLLREGVPTLAKVPGVAGRAEPAVKDLTKTFADARPFAPRVAAALDDLAAPLGVLVPYGPEIAQFFVRGHSFVSEGPEEGVRFARLSPNVGIHSVTGGLYASENYRRNDYPEPGEATSDRVESGLPSGIIPSGGDQ